MVLLLKINPNRDYRDRVLWGFYLYHLSGAAKGLDNGFEREFQDMAMNSMFVWPQRTSVPYAGFKVGRYPVLLFLMLKN